MAALSLLACFGCSDKPPANVDNTPPKSPIEVATVHPQPVTDSLVLAAKVEPDPTRVVHVYSQITGRLVELYVRPGQEVTKGRTSALFKAAIYRPLVPITIRRKSR